MDVAHRDSDSGDNDQSEARQWLQKAAEKGSVAARYELWKNTLTDSVSIHGINIDCNLYQAFQLYCL